MVINLFSSSGVQRHPRLRGWRGWKGLRQNLWCELFNLLFWWKWWLFQFQLENSFKCARSNKDKCIPAEQRCDGIWHCEDKSDEMNCREVGSMSRENDISSLICSVPWRTRSCVTATAIPTGCAAMDSPTAPMEATSWAALVRVSWRRFEEKLYNNSHSDCLGSHSNTYMCQMTERCMRRDEVDNS